MGEKVSDGAALQPGDEPVRRTVLVVEDEILVRYALAMALRAQGLKVLEASSAGEALALLSSGLSVQVLFSDIQMPGALDGVALAGTVRERYPEVAIILTSGKPPPPEVGSLGLFVPKPYAPEAVLATILARLDGTAAGGTLEQPSDGGGDAA